MENSSYKKGMLQYSDKSQNKTCYNQSYEDKRQYIPKYKKYQDDYQNEYQPKSNFHNDRGYYEKKNYHKKYETLSNEECPDNTWVKSNYKSKQYKNDRPNRSDKHNDFRKKHENAEYHKVSIDNSSDSENSFYSNFEIQKKKYSGKKEKIQLIREYKEKDVSEENTPSVEIQTDNKKDFGCTNYESLETIYNMINENTPLDKSIQWEKIDMGSEITIDGILENDDMVFNFFVEILKILKKYSFVRLNYFHLKVINKIVNMGFDKNYKNDYVRIIQRPIEEVDSVYFRSFISTKIIKLFKTSSVHTEEKFTKLAYTTTYKLSHKLSQQYGIITNCCFYYQGVDNEFIVHFNDFQILEIINLIRQIYHIKPSDY